MLFITKPNVSHDYLNLFKEGKPVVYMKIGNKKPCKQPTIKAMVREGPSDEILRRDEARRSKIVLK